MFPASEPYNQGLLRVSSVHSLYYEEVGLPNGAPILFIHGGPGGGINEYARCFFDPNFYRAILFDQRGSGKSLPYASIQENTTQDLIADIERLRKFLNIEKWVIMGGSWGSTLALAYTIAHPERVRGIILRGVFLARSKEIQWLYGSSGAARIFPDAYSLFMDPLSKEERSRPVESYFQRLTDPSVSVQSEAVLAWNRWESSISQLIPDLPLEDFDSSYEDGLAIARIEAHYFTNDSFFPSDNYILENISAIQNHPCIIIQGRYDIVCPTESAYELHHALAHSELNIIPNAGHSTAETGISRGLLLALEDFKSLYDDPS
ncbi:MAG: prolyl aminopeptidase [Myxococcota bacterium]|nr:prolyl aminopeptidase [Myxococcota bacterium]